MGNQQAAVENPWASVAQAAKDGRAKEARAVNGSGTAAAQVHTTAVKLPGTIVYSTVRLTDDDAFAPGVAFQVTLSEPCKLELLLDDEPVATSTFETAGTHEFGASLKLNPREHRIVICLKSLSDSNRDSLKVTLLAKSDRVLILRKQAEIGGRTVDLEEVYGIGSAKECVICLVEISDTTFVPCRHMCTCSECASMLTGAPSPDRKCPICRTLIAQIVKVTAST